MTAADHLALRFIVAFVRASVRIIATRLAQSQLIWLNSDAIPMFEEWLYNGRRIEWINRRILHESAFLNLTGLRYSRAW
jgi:hypothetical protein